MSELVIKRIGLIVACLVAGYAVTFVTMEIIVGTTMEEYGGMYTFFTTLSFAGIPFVWGDKFLQTGLLSE